MHHLIVAVATLLSACATSRHVCGPGETSSVNDILYFGMAKPAGGVITLEEWDDFLRSAVTSRFPAGLSSWPAAGQWRGANGQVVREDSHVLNLLHPADAVSEQSIRQIIGEYKRRFGQEAVLRVRSDACTSL